jgi:D-glycero-D-manno-heptose 1,7-bisphosphate phosphatase
LKRAVFLDRDGVLNRLVFNPATQAFESPHRPEDLAIHPRLGESLEPLQKAGFLLFLVSNQPSFAKGKATLEALRAVHGLLERRIEGLGLRFSGYFYCYHHPESLVPELKVICGCRKPGTLFLEQAIQAFGLERGLSWMVGDQDSDIECGIRAGLRTVLIQTPESADKRGASRPDFQAEDLEAATRLILGRRQGPHPSAEGS